jgi:hypothetical protein
MMRPNSRRPHAGTDEARPKGAVYRGRYTAEMPDDFVVFLIGMRLNRPWKVHKWFPVFLAMPRMLRWPALGANMDAESARSGAPRIDFVRDAFSVSEAMTYYQFVLEEVLDHERTDAG